MSLSLQAADESVVLHIEADPAAVGRAGLQMLVESAKVSHNYHSNTVINTIS